MEGPINKALKQNRWLSTFEQIWAMAVVIVSITLERPTVLSMPNFQGSAADHGDENGLPLDRSGGIGHNLGTD